MYILLLLLPFLFAPLIYLVIILYVDNVVLSRAFYKIISKILN